MLPMCLFSFVPASVTKVPFSIANVPYTVTNVPNMSQVCLRIYLSLYI